MARLTIAITLAAAFLASGFAAPTAPATPGKAAVSIPFSRFKSSPNWKQAVTADKSRARHFGNQSKTVQASSSFPAVNEEFSYVADVTVGTQTFSLVIDTGKWSLRCMTAINVKTTSCAGFISHHMSSKAKYRHVSQVCWSVQVRVQRSQSVNHSNQKVAFVRGYFITTFWHCTLRHRYTWKWNGKERECTGYIALRCLVYSTSPSCWLVGQPFHLQQVEPQLSPADPPSWFARLY